MLHWFPDVVWSKQKADSGDFLEPKTSFFDIFISLLY